MPTEIWRDFDPNLDIPVELKNARYAVSPDVVDELPDPDAIVDEQTETWSDDNSQLSEDEIDDELEVPSSFTIVSQTIRTGKGGRQVVDVVIEVEEVDGADKYEFRLKKV